MDQFLLGIQLSYCWPAEAQSSTLGIGNCFGVHRWPAAESLRCTWCLFKCFLLWYQKSLSSSCSQGNLIFTRYWFSEFRLFCELFIGRLKWREIVVIRIWEWTVFLLFITFFFHFMCIFLFCCDISITVSTYNVTANLWDSSLLTCNSRICKKRKYGNAFVVASLMELVILFILSVSYNAEMCNLCNPWYSENLWLSLYERGPRKNAHMAVSCPTLLNSGLGDF